MNKTLVKVAGIISLVTGILYCISIFLIPIGVLNIIASKKLRDAADGTGSKKSAQNWSIYLLFTDAVSGILGLIGTTSEGSSNDISAEEKLRNIKRLYDDGIISQDEYEARRSEIINKL